EPVEQKLRDAVKSGKVRTGTDREVVEAGVLAGIITEDEAVALRLAHEARRDATRVDDFPRL
ncbi:MAG TPA: acyl-CoA dehydrogenase domain-containing protein, partial [Rhodocyclaceae bacterium]|nr:acyl-CoA dehydrogenase domain-containing protein [Rhodocyclaceae bacterium]